jgi:uncharacterized DUF497 family protein
VRVIWDPEKARQNVMKHGVRFSDAEGVLYDPLAISQVDDERRGEHRFVSIGTDHVGQVLVVVYTYRGEDVRLISARRPTRRERQFYEEGI